MFLLPEFSRSRLPAKFQNKWPTCVRTITLYTLELYCIMCTYNIEQVKVHFSAQTPFFTFSVLGPLFFFFSLKKFLEFVHAIRFPSTWLLKGQRRLGVYGLAKTKSCNYAHKTEMEETVVLQS